MANRFVPTLDQLKKTWKFFKQEIFPNDGYLAATATYSIEQLSDLWNQIRKIRDNFGDDKCWMDWNALFMMLPEGYTPPKEDIQIQLEHCKQYLACLSEGTVYMPPPRWVKGLPDKPGVWVLTTNTGFRFTISYGGGAPHDLRDEKIVWSFGPIPREPECLSKSASN